MNKLIFHTELMILLVIIIKNDSKFRNCFAFASVFSFFFIFATR